MPGIHSARLRAARTLIATPETWTRGAYARDAHRLAVAASSPSATCFCGMGALMRAAGRDTPRITLTATYLRGSSGELWIPWHDAPERTPAEVLIQIDRGIAQAEAEGN